MPSTAATSLKAISSADPARSSRREALIREPDVDLILDRRVADRRAADSPIERERRGGQRRLEAVDAELREYGWAVIRLPGAARR